MDIIFEVTRERYNQILNGQKNHTIRNGFREILPNETIRLGYEVRGGRNVLERNVASVIYTTIANLSIEEVNAYGYNHHAHMLNSLRKNYPNISDTDLITIIKFI